MKNRITAAEARDLVGKARMSVEDALDQIDITIEGQAGRQANFTLCTFPAAALDEAELAEVLANLEERGYTAEATSSDDFRSVNIRWN